MTQSVTRLLKLAEAPIPVPSVRPTAEIPETSGWPILGNAVDLAGGVREFPAREYRKHGPIFRVRALHHRFIALVGPEANVFLAQISGAHFRSYEPYRDFAADSGGHRFVLALEDLGAMKTITQVGGANAEQAQLVIREIAGFQGQFWEAADAPSLSAGGPFLSLRRVGFLALSRCGYRAYRLGSAAI